VPSALPLLSFPTFFQDSFVWNFRLLYSLSVCRQDKSSEQNIVLLGIRNCDDELIRWLLSEK